MDLPKRSLYFFSTVCLWIALYLHGTSAQILGGVTGEESPGGGGGGLLPGTDISFGETPIVGDGGVITGGTGSGGTGGTIQVGGTGGGTGSGGRGVAPVTTTTTRVPVTTTTTTITTTTTTTPMTTTGVNGCTTTYATTTDNVTLRPWEIAMIVLGCLFGGMMIVGLMCMICCYLKKRCPGQQNTCVTTGSYIPHSVQCGRC